MINLLKKICNHGELVLEKQDQVGYKSSRQSMATDFYGRGSDSPEKKKSKQSLEDQLNFEEFLAENFFDIKGAHDALLLSSKFAFVLEMLKKSGDKLVIVSNLRSNSDYNHQLY